MARGIDTCHYLECICQKLVLSKTCCIPVHVSAMTIQTHGVFPPENMEPHRIAKTDLQPR